MRLWSFRRFDGFHWAKAIRDIRSPPNVAWGFRLDTEAITSPEASSSSVVTTLVVPTSIATPNAIAVVSPRSTPRGAPLERDDRHLALGLAERGRERADHVERDVLRREAGRQRELLEIRRLVVLLLRQLDPDQRLADPGVHGDLRPDDRARLDTQDLERALVEGRRDLDDEGLRRHQLAGESVSLAHQVVAELKLIADRAGRGHALDDLHPAGRAAAAAAAGGRDVHSLGVRRAKQGRAGLDGDRPAVRQHRHGDGGHTVILDHGTPGTSRRRTRWRAPGPRPLQRGRYSRTVQDVSPPAGRVVAVSGAGTRHRETRVPGGSSAAG